MLVEMQQKKKRDSLNRKAQEMGENEVLPPGWRNGGRSISIHSCSESWNDGQGLSVPIPHSWFTCTDSDINLDLRCACLTPSEPSWRAECGPLNGGVRAESPRKSELGSGECKPCFRWHLYAWDGTGLAGLRATHTHTHRGLTPAPECCECKWRLSRPQRLGFLLGFPSPFNPPTPRPFLKQPANLRAQFRGKGFLLCSWISKIS